MSDDKIGNKTGPEGLSETDKGYYEDLYNDLPKEVVDILMQTHPLMGKNDDLEATAYRARRPQRREDVEEVKEARMHVSRRARNAESAHTSAPKGNTMNQDDYDDGIQYVSVLPARKKSKIVEEVTLQTAAPAKHHGKKKKHKKEREPFDDMGMEERDYRPRYEDMDFEERAKQEHLDSLYDEEYYDDYGRGRGKLPMILGVVAVVLIIFLIFRTVSLSSKLEEVQNQLTQSQDYKQKYEDMQLENMQLQEKLDGKDTKTTGNSDAADTKKDTKKDTKADTASTSSGTKEYTVQKGDTMWTIAQSQLGNGAEYQKILDANGLKESDTLAPGTVIKIPQ